MQPFDFADYTSSLPSTFPMQLTGPDIVTYFANQVKFLKPRCKTLIIKLTLTNVMNVNVILELLMKLNLSCIRFAIIVIEGAISKEQFFKAKFHDKIVCIASDNFIIRYSQFSKEKGYDIDFCIAERIMYDLTSQRKVYWSCKSPTKTSRLLYNLSKKLSFKSATDIPMNINTSKRRLDRLIHYSSFQSINIKGYYKK